MRDKEKNIYDAQLLASVKATYELDKSVANFAKLKRNAENFAVSNSFDKVEMRKSIKALKGTSTTTQSKKSHVFDTGGMSANPTKKKVTTESPNHVAVSELEKDISDLTAQELNAKYGLEKLRDFARQKGYEIEGKNWLSDIAKLKEYVEGTA